MLQNSKDIEWKENLDSWKSRRRKMSEDVFRRQEEIRQFEQEEQSKVTTDKKTKTFSQMVESRAHRGRSLSLCLISSPLEIQEWGPENKNVSTHPFSDGSEENSAVNSEDERVSDKTNFQKSLWSECTNGNGIKNDSPNNCQNKRNETSCTDSGLESISSSHRTGDTPDSCSDFSQDSGSSIDCDSPRVSGMLLHSVNILQDLSSQESLKKDFHEPFHERKLQMQEALSDQSEEISSASINCDIPLREHLSENGTRCSVESEVFVDELEELHAKSEVFVLSSEDSSADQRAIAKVESVEISNEVPKEVNADERDLCIIFQSQSSDLESPFETSKTDVAVPALEPCDKVVLNDVLPVEKVAEEMEKLILQQLEEEERAKEISLKMQGSPYGSPDHNFIAPSKVSEPPKEKPPPPPCTENEVQKPTSLKRVNSTKRIKKEIHKRRSNFLGIDDADENLVPAECLMQPPPALEQLLKAEMELERESRRRLESEADLRLKLEECEMMEKEREILASLDAGEAARAYEEELCAMQEVDRIQTLIEERKKAESEQAAAEAERMRLIEEQQLRDREEYIRKQEVGIESSAETSAPVLFDVANLSRTAKPSNAFPLNTQPISVSDNSGEKGLCASLSAPVECNGGAVETKPSLPAKPAVPPKPLKKKEAIRKERERLRQEQEALQREREEHRQRLLREQEELSKSQPIPHAPLLSRVGPVPLPKPSFQSPLTSSVPREQQHVIYASHGLQGATGHNVSAAANGYVDPIRSPATKLNKQTPSPKNSHPADPWVRQKSPSPKKSPSTDDGRYNQNHWLIQEAEMRRLAELQERHPPRPRTHLAEDGAVCGPLAAPPLHSRPWPPCAPPPAKPGRAAAATEHVLSVSGRKRCSHCSEELGRGAAMIIESLQLYYHIHCFQCCVCQAQLGNGSCGTDVRVRNNKLHCHNCYSNDEAGLKFSQV